MKKPKIKGQNMNDLEIPDDLWESFIQGHNCGECNECEEEGYMCSECDAWNDYIITIREESGLVPYKWAFFLKDEFQNSNLDTYETTSSIEMNGLSITALCMACKFGEDSHYWESWMLFYKNGGN